MGFSIRVDDVSQESVRELMTMHAEAMARESPPGLSFSLDATGLRHESVTVWTAWEGEVLAGMAALKQLSATLGEVKSMRTHAAFVRRGVAATLLSHLIEVARRRGLSRLSLETGTGPAFAAAVALYERFGFESGEAFGDYPTTPFNQYFHLDLSPHL